MNLILYTKLGCVWCREVLSFLREKNVPFEEREVLGNRAYFEELREKSGQEKTPTLNLDGAILADTDRDAVEVFLKKHGMLK